MDQADEVRLLADSCGHGHLELRAGGRSAIREVEETDTEEAQEGRKTNATPQKLPRKHHIDPLALSQDTEA